MDAVTVCSSVAFGLFLAALALIPNLLAIYVGLRAGRLVEARKSRSPLNVVDRSSQQWGSGTGAVNASR